MLSRKLSGKSLDLAGGALKEAALNLIAFKKMHGLEEFQRCQQLETELRELKERESEQKREGSIRVSALAFSKQISQKLNKAGAGSKLYLLEEEYCYFYCLINEREFTEVFLPADLDIEAIAAKVETFEFALGLHSTLDTVQDAAIQYQAAPFLSFAKFLSGLKIFAQCLPPIWTALNGALGFWDVYRTFTTPQTKLAKAVKLTATLGGVGLSIAALACPPVALALGAAAMALGFLRDSSFYFEAQNDLDNERLQLAEYKCRLAKLRDEEGRMAPEELNSADRSTIKRRKFLEHALKKQEKRVEELQAVRNGRRSDLFFSCISILGGLLLMPPTTAIGIGIILGVVAVKIEQRFEVGRSILRLLGSGLKRIFCRAPENNQKKDSSSEMSPKFDKDSKSILKQINSSGVSHKVSPSPMKEDRATALAARRDIVLKDRVADSLREVVSAPSYSRSFTA